MFLVFPEFFFQFKKPLSSGQTFKITARSGISFGSHLQNDECEPQIFWSIGEWGNYEPCKRQVLCGIKTFPRSVLNIIAYWGIIVINFYLNISIFHCASCNTFSARQNIVSVRKNAATYSDLFRYPLSVNHTQKDLKLTENVIPIACFKR